MQNDCGMEYLPINEMWKMYPPRYDINSHEIVMDNDFIIFDKCQVLEDFFKGNHTLLLRGKARSYGKYDHLVPQPFAINSGFFGMPPNFDFLKKIKYACKNDIERKWTSWCDDQGIITHCLMQEEFKVIENDIFKNYFAEDDYDLSYNIKGLHLIGLNRGKRKNWKSILSKYLIKYV